MDNEFMMELYERLDKELEELHERIYSGKYEPTCDPYWEGVLHGIDNAWQAVEKIFMEVANGRI